MQEQIFTSIPLQQLKELLGEVVKAELSAIVDKQKYEGLINTEEACEVLKVTKVTLLNWREKGWIPFYKMGSRIYFKKSELLAALENVPNRKGRRKSK